jgi:hypothetical protein
MGEACGTCGEEERCLQGFGGETCGKQATWKTHTQVDNIKMDLQELI